MEFPSPKVQECPERSLSSESRRSKFTQFGGNTDVGKGGRITAKLIRSIKHGCYSKGTM